MAGESARESAVRQRAKGERLLRSAELWERGAEGEEATAAVLAQLPAATWTVFHDVRWPGRRYANVDHIVVGPPGVFVIDSKNWSGRITVEADVLRQNGRQRETTVAGAAEAGLAVGALVPSLSPRMVHPVLCFVREDALSGWARDVMVCSTGNLVSMLTTRPAVLDDVQRTQLCLDLDLGLREAGASAPPVVRRSLPPRKPSRASTRGRRSKRRSWVPDLVKLLVVVAVLGVLLLRPEAVTGLADRVARLFVDEVVTPVPEPTPDPPKKRPADRERKRVR